MLSMRLRRAGLSRLRCHPRGGILRPMTTMEALVLNRQSRVTGISARVHGGEERPLQLPRPLFRRHSAHSCKAHLQEGVCHLLQVGVAGHLAGAVQCSAGVVVVVVVVKRPPPALEVSTRVLRLLLLQHPHLLQRVIPQPRLRRLRQHLQQKLQSLRSARVQS